MSQKIKKINSSAKSTILGTKFFAQQSLFDGHEGEARILLSPNQICSVVTSSSLILVGGQHQPATDLLSSLSEASWQDDLSEPLTWEAGGTGGAHFSLYLGKQRHPVEDSGVLQAPAL